MECRACVIVYCTQVEQHGDIQSASYVINLESRLLDTFFAVVFFLVLFLRSKHQYAIV